MKKIIFAIALTLTFSAPAFGISADDKHAAQFDTVFYDNAVTPDACSASTGSLPGSVPAPYHDIFIKAAGKHNVEPALIAAIFFAGEHGSSWPHPPPPYGTGSGWATSSANAQGPFQFIPGTWATYGEDGNGDGKKDVQDLTDAAFGAANLFEKDGAAKGATDDKIKKVIFLYNHSDSYVSTVFTAYQKFLAGDSGPSTVGGDCGGGLGVSGNFTFPLKTTQAVIKNNNPAWCYNSQSSCHHDYKAADIFAPIGTTEVAAVSGKILYVKFPNGPCSSGSKSSGTPHFQMLGDDGVYYYYNHMKPGSIVVKDGDTVKAGDPVGQIGPAECAEGSPPHLHFQMSKKEILATIPSEYPNYINPQPYLIPAFNNLPGK